MDAHSRLVSFFQFLGVDHVTDTLGAADIALLETTAEFETRMKQAQPRPWGAPETSVAVSSVEQRHEDHTCRPIVRTIDQYTALPMLTSACPGWICYAEKTQPAVLPYISTTKSPQQILGTVLKRVVAAERNMDPKQVFHATIMPCFDKKLEASRRDFYHADFDVQEVDVVLTTIEILQFIEHHAHQLGKEPGDWLAALPSPTVGTPSGSVTHLLTGHMLGTGTAMGLLDLASATAGRNGSDGFAEFVFRRAAHDLFGVSFSPDEPLPYVQGRNEDLHELILERDGQVHLP